MFLLYHITILKSTYCLCYPKYMDLDNLLLRDDTSTEIGDPMANVSSLTDAMAPLMWLSFVLTIIFIGLYVRSIYKRRKLEKAIFDIQKTVHEINQRDKTRNAPALRPQTPGEKETIIARVDEPEENT